MFGFKSEEKNEACFCYKDNTSAKPEAKTFSTSHAALICKMNTPYGCVHFQEHQTRDCIIKRQEELLISMDAKSVIVACIRLNVCNYTSDYEVIFTYFMWRDSASGMQVCAQPLLDAFSGLYQSKAYKPET